MNNNSQSKLQYNVIIKPSGYGKSYRLMEELRKEQCQARNNVKS